MYSNVKQKFNGPLRKNSQNPRYFTDASGKAIYLTGSHTWAVMNDMWLENGEPHRMNYKGFLDMMESNHHNFLRFWQFNMQPKGAPWNKVETIFEPQPYTRIGPGMARDGKPKFDLEKFNEDYFIRLRERVKLAEEKGIYVSVMLFEAWAVKWGVPKSNPWDYYPFNSENNINNITDNPVVDGVRAWDIFSLNCPQILEAQKRYVKKVIDALNDYDNVLYEICNEMPFRKEALEWQQYLCNFIREYESTLPKQHMIGITAEGGDQDNSDLFATSADWISPSNGYNFEYRYNPPAADGSKVILNDTDHLWGHGCELGWIWKSFTRGMNVLLMDPWEPIPGDLDWWQDGDVTKNQRFYYAWDSMRRNLGYTKLFAVQMDMNKCTPHNELCTSTYCLANPDEQYLCFFPSGGSEGVDLRQATGEFNVYWFDSVKGIGRNGGTVNGGSRQAMESSIDGASVLFLYKTKDDLLRKHDVF